MKQAAVKIKTHLNLRENFRKYANWIQDENQMLPMLFKISKKVTSLKPQKESGGRGHIERKMKIKWFQCYSKHRKKLLP